MGSKREKKKKARQNKILKNLKHEPYTPVNINTLINKGKEEFTDKDWRSAARVAIKLRRIR